MNFKITLNKAEIKYLRQLLFCERGMTNDIFKENLISSIDIKLGRIVPNIWGNKKKGA